MNRNSAATLLAIALGGAGCQCNQRPQQDQSPLQLFGPDSIDLAAKMSFDFGDACIGTGKDVTFTYGSGNGAQILVTPSDLTTDGSPEFVIVNPPTAAFYVPGTTTLTIHFAPSTAGPRAGTLTIKAADNADNVPLAISLTGIGSNGAGYPIFGTSCPVGPPGTFPASPCTSMFFSNVYFGSTQRRSVTIFNDGGCPPFLVDSVTIAYDGGGMPFTLPTLVVPQSIDPARQYEVVVEYSPQCPSATPSCSSALNDATLLIHTTNGFDGDAGVFPVDLTGAGITPTVSLTGPDGGLTCQSFSRDGGLAYEREPVTVTLTLTNGSVGTPIVVGTPYIDAGNIGFTLDTSRCWAGSAAMLLSDGGVSLPTKGSSVTCDVKFDVVDADPANRNPPLGIFNAVFSAPYTALETGQAAQSGTASICLHALSEPKACWSPPLLTIGLPEVTYCGQVSQDLQFNNCGSQDLIVSDISLGTDLSGTFSLDAGGLVFPVTWQWADAPATVTVTFTDQGKVMDPSTTVILSSNDPSVPDGGTLVHINAKADAVCPTPDTLTPQFQMSGPGNAGAVYQVDVTPSLCPAPYSLDWYYQRFDTATGPAAQVLDAGELATDGGYHAWLTPAAMGFTYNVCVDVAELPLPDGGNCHLRSQNCTPNFVVR